jgi:hypothetical protein
MVPARPKAKAVRDPLALIVECARYAAVMPQVARFCRHCGRRLNPGPPPLPLPHSSDFEA